MGHQPAPTTYRAAALRQLALATLLGAFTNAFSVAGFFVTDPLRASRTVNRPLSYATLLRTTSFRLRFQRYYEYDSRFDDQYTPGYRASRTEWYGRFVLVLPIR